MKVVKYGNDYGIKVGRYTVWGFRSEEEAKRVFELAKKNRWGSWQVEIARDLIQNGRIHAELEFLLSGRALNFKSKYRRSLEKVVAVLGAVFVPGPKGGRWKGYYILQKN